MIRFGATGLSTTTARILQPDPVVSPAVYFCFVFAAARLYALHEEHLLRTQRLDFDDLMIAPIRLLQDDAHLRERWQARFERVLVDEYQDIEPAQALRSALQSTQSHAYLNLKYCRTKNRAGRRPTSSRISSPSSRRGRVTQLLREAGIKGC